MKFLSTSSLIFFYSAFLMCCAGKAYQKITPEVFSVEEKRIIIEEYNSNQSDHSASMGSLMLQEMHQVYPDFAEELAEIPELQDGINEKEARALIQINDIVQNTNISQNEINSTGYIISVKGKCDNGNYLSFQILNLKPLDIVSIQPLNFENNDKFTRVSTRDGLDFEWQPNVSNKDTDTILINVDSSAPDYFRITYGGNMNKLPLNDLQYPSTMEFEKGYVTISMANNRDRTAFGLLDLTMAGKGGSRFSAPMQALFWGYIDGKHNGNPLENYTNKVDFIKPIWGDMTGERRIDFKTTMARLTEPEILDYYERENHIYEQYKGGKYLASQVHLLKKRNCYDSCRWREYALKKSPYKYSRMHVHPSNPHDVTIFKRDKYYYVIDNGYPEPLGILGPYKKLTDSPYTIIWTKSKLGI